MSINDPLHELIHSLEPAEKRHFKIFAKRHILNGENQYLRLFDVLESLPKYDESLVKHRLGRTRFAENLSSSKNYLYNLLLRSLRNYNAGASTKINLQELRLDIHTLIDKGLLKQALKLIKKAKKLAAQHQYDIDQLEIVLLERKLIRRYTSNKADTLLGERQAEAATCIRRVQEQFQMLDLYETVFLNYRNQNKSQTDLIKVVQQAEILATETPEELSFEATNYYHLLNYHYAYGARDYKKANFHLHALIDLLENNPFLIEEDQDRYLNHLNNYLNTCLPLNKLEEFPRVLEKMRQVPAKSFKIKALIFNNGYYLEMLYHLIRQEYQAVIQMVPKIEAGLKEYAANITKSRKLTFSYNIAIAYFLEKSYDHALEWINRILYEPKLEERQDIQSLARIFQLVIHFELGNADFVESLILSANRYLLKKDKRDSAEFLIIKHLKEALYANKHQQHNIFAQLSTALQGMKGLEEIQLWLQTKL